jgi:hypothetical protein
VVKIRFKLDFGAVVTNDDPINQYKNNNHVHSLIQYSYMELQYICSAVNRLFLLVFQYSSQAENI